MLLVALVACSAGLTQSESEQAQVPDSAAMAEPVEDRYAAAHVLISHQGAVRAVSERTEAEAKARASEIWQRVLDGEPLDELARRYSEGPSAPRGGAIGVYRPGTMMPAFERAVAAVAEGEVTRPFKTAFGWHVARRETVVEARARHILVTWRGAVRSARRRTKSQARDIIEQAQTRLGSGEAFEDVARDLGDDVTAPRGGDLGVVAPGQLVPAFEKALFALSPGERSSIVETAYGFHIIERVP